MRNNNYLLSIALLACSTTASADILLTGRTSNASAEAVHRTLNGPLDGYGQDADSSVTLFKGDLASSATASPYTYGGTAWSTVDFSAHSLTVGGLAAADAPPNGSFSNAVGTSYIELRFTVDALTHVDIELGENRVGEGYHASGLLQLYRGNTLLKSHVSQTNFFEWVRFPEYISLDLLPGDYRIVGNYEARSYYGSCVYGYCLADSYMTLTTTSLISAVPLPAAGWLMGAGLLGLAGAARRRK